MFTYKSKRHIPKHTLIRGDKGWYLRVGHRWASWMYYVSYLFQCHGHQWPTKAEAEAFARQRITYWLTGTEHIGEREARSIADEFPIHEHDNTTAWARLNALIARELETAEYINAIYHKGSHHV